MGYFSFCLHNSIWKNVGLSLPQLHAAGTGRSKGGTTTWEEAGSRVSAHHNAPGDVNEANWVSKEKSGRSFLFIRIVCLLKSSYIWKDILCEYKSNEWIFFSDDHILPSFLWEAVCADPPLHLTLSRSPFVCPCSFQLQQESG